MRNIYLSSVDLEHALSMLERLPIPAATEWIDSTGCLGRVCASSVWAQRSSPSYTASAMDGIAVLAERTKDANEKNLLKLVENQDFVYVNTGEKVPKGFDSVIIIENVIQIEGEVFIASPIAPFENVRPVGEDITQGELLLPANREITPPDIGALLSGGITQIEVWKKPLVGVIPTGNELISPYEEACEGKIVESNSSMFAAYIHEFGGVSKVYPIVPDEIEKIEVSVKQAVAECDIVLIGAGSSAGSRDFTKTVVERLGVVLCHGLNIKPGKPCVVGTIQNKPVIGVPGYPVSACVVMEELVYPLLSFYTRKVVKKPQTVEAVISKNVLSGVKSEEYVRVKLGNVGDRLIAAPLPRGAGMLTSLVRANGIVKIPRNAEGYSANERVTVHLRQDIEKINDTLVVIGSHDPVIDIVNDFMGNISSTHGGSMGGILALMNHQAHVAPIHLLNETDGSYNISYVTKYLKDVALFKFVSRTQGFMVKKGNPKGIRDVQDLLLKGVSYINRQTGSGTRILLDYLLKQRELDPSGIYGYTRCETTHMTTAAAVANDVDCALGVLSAANAFGLDFIPVCDEEYDLAIPTAYLELPVIQTLFEVVQKPEFLQRLDELGGYKTDGMLQRKL